MDIPSDDLTNTLLLNMAINIVSLPRNQNVVIHSYVNVYQRVVVSKLETCKVTQRALWIDDSEPLLMRKL